MCREVKYSFMNDSGEKVCKTVIGTIEVEKDMKHR